MLDFRAGYSNELFSYFFVKKKKQAARLLHLIYYYSFTGTTAPSYFSRMKSWISFE
jgi:hypothetical protein